MTVNMLIKVKYNFSNKNCRMISATGIIYRSICPNIFFINFKIEENELFCIWNSEQILIYETPKIVSDKSKYF